MNIAEQMRQSAKHARKLKEEHVREVKGQRGRTDILTIVEAFRGDEPIAVTFSPPHRDLMLRLADLLARGLSADSMAITMETYHVDVPRAEHGEINPDTGERWGQGEMHEYFEKHGPGLVNEALCTVVVNRADDLNQTVQPYLLDGRSLSWLPYEDPEIGKPVGIVPETLRRVMARPTLQTYAGTMPFKLSLSAEEKQATMDVATVLKLPETADSEEVAMLMFAIPGSVRHQTLRKFFGPSSIRDPRKWN